MKNILFLLLLTIAFATHAQNPTNDLLSHVPADASQVTDVNLGSITSKMDLPSILNLVGNKTHNNKNLAMIQQLLTSGLDIHQNVIVAQTNSGKIDSIQYITFILHLTDSAKFVAFMRSKAKEANGEPLHFIHLPGKERVAVHDKDAAAWNDHLAVLTVFTVPRSSNGPLVPIATAQLKAARRVAAALRGFSDTKFSTDTRFTTAFSDGGDVHLWSAKGQWLSMLEKFSKKMPGMGQFGNMSQFAGKSSVSGPSISTLRFENGRISYRTLKFVNPTELAAIQRTLGQGLSPELLALVPPRPLLGVAALHFDIAAIEDTLKRNPSFPMIDTMMQSKGVSVMDILHALKGDFVFLVCQPDKPTADTTGKKKMPAPAMFLIATINDKAAFEKVLPMIKVKNAMDPVTADTTMTDTAAHKKNPFQYYIEKDDLIVLGKRHQLKEFLNNPPSGDPIGKLLPSQVRENAFDAGIDLHGLVTALVGPMLTPADSQDPKGKAILDMLQQFQTLQISFGAIHDGAMETNVELNLTDQNKNSLTILTNMITTLAAQTGGQPQ
jgi:hypothetical protein